MLLVLAFALVCAAPLAVAAATGMVSGVGLVTDRAETSGDEGAAAAGNGTGGPPGTGTADVPPPSSAPATAAPAPAPAPAPSATPSPAPSPPATPAPTAAPPPPTPVEQVLALVNQARAAGPGHCGPIQLESHLTAAAQGHSDDMAARNYFSHDTPEGLDFSARITNAGYPGFAAAENIAKGQRSAQRVMTDWMNSPGHRTNIENCQYTAIGIGLNTTAWTWTQDFGF